MQWHTPIGYKVLNGKIVVYEEHRKIVEQIFRDYDSGISALRIAKDLKDRGIKNAHDRVGWSHASIGRILENYNYLGTEDYEQIIDKELFERVQKKREQVRIEGSRGKHRPNKRERLIFSGVLRCAECGCPYSHIQPHSKRVNGIPKWKCKNYVYQNKVSLLWSSFFVTLVAKKIVLINLCCRPCFIWGSITIITVWTNMIIINVCKFFYLLIECFLCCKLIQICAFILQGIEITLHRCIVVRISCFAHALCHIYRFAEFGKCFGRIL